MPCTAHANTSQCTVHVCMHASIQRANTALLTTKPVNKDHVRTFSDVAKMQPLTFGAVLTFVLSQVGMHNFGANIHKHRKTAYIAFILVLSIGNELKTCSVYQRFDGQHVQDTGVLTPMYPRGIAAPQGHAFHLKNEGYSNFGWVPKTTCFYVIIQLTFGQRAENAGAPSAEWSIAECLSFADQQRCTSN